MKLFTNYTHLLMLVPVLTLAFLGKEVPIALLIFPLVGPALSVIPMLRRPDKHPSEARLDALESMLAEQKETVQNISIANNMRSF